MDAGLTLGMTVHELPDEASPEAQVQLLQDELKKRNVAFGVEPEALQRIVSERILDEEVEVAHGIGVERTFLIHSPRIDKIEVLRHGRVRRAQLYYLRGRVGKSAKIKERRAR